MKVLAGDYEGSAQIKFGVLWTGPKADKFRGIQFGSPSKTYAPNEISRFKPLDAETTKTFLRTAASGVIGGVLLGPAGLLAGVLVGGKKITDRYGIEFTDGKRVIVKGNPRDKAFRCLLLFVEASNKLEAPAQIEF